MKGCYDAIVMVAKNRAHGYLLVCLRLRLESGLQIITPFREFVIERLYGLLKFCRFVWLQIVFAVFESVDLSQESARNFVELDHMNHSSHERWLALCYRRARKILWKMIIVHINRYLDITVRIIDAKGTTQGQGKHAVKGVHAPPNFSASLLLNRTDEKPTW
jgi:hypothetical protein